MHLTSLTSATAQSRGGYFLHPGLPLPWSYGFLPLGITTRAVIPHTALPREEHETEVWFLWHQHSFCAMVKLNHVNGTILRWGLCVARRSQLC